MQGVNLRLILFSDSFWQTVQNKIIGFENPVLNLIRGKGILNENIIPMPFIQMIGCSNGFIFFTKFLSFLWR